MWNEFERSTVSCGVALTLEQSLQSAGEDIENEGQDYYYSGVVDVILPHNIHGVSALILVLGVHGHCEAIGRVKEHRESCSCVTDTDYQEGPCQRCFFFFISRTWEI